MSRKLISTLTLLLLILLVSLFFFFIRTQDSIYQAEDESIALVKHDYQIKRVNNFYWSTIQETYFSLDFVDKDDVHRYAIISQEGGEVKYFTNDEIINQEEARSIVLNDMNPHDIMQLRLSLIDDQPVWEASIKNENGMLTYYTINAKDGKWVQTVENI